MAVSVAEPEIGGASAGYCGSGITKGRKEIVQACIEDPTVFWDLIVLGTVIWDTLDKIDFTTGTDFKLTAANDFVATITNNIEHTAKDIKLTALQDYILEAVRKVSVTAQQTDVTGNVDVYEGHVAIRDNYLELHDIDNPVASPGCARLFSKNGALYAMSSGWPVPRRILTDDDYWTLWNRYP